MAKVKKKIIKEKVSTVPVWGINGGPEPFAKLVEKIKFYTDSNGERILYFEGSYDDE